MNNNHKLNQTIQLNDGRKLGYTDLGNSEGKPIFHFHGFPGSRLETTLIAEKVIQRGGRLIGVDRPGMGLSDFKKNRTILDWADDVLELANYLNIDKFAVEGISGGGPYSAVCAYKIPDRLTACGIIAGVGPIALNKEGMMKSNRRLFFIIRNFPWLFRIAISFQARGMKNLKKAEKKMKKGLDKFPESDQKILSDPSILPLFLKESAEAFRQGSKGVTHDGRLYTKPWGFNPKDISSKLKVVIWHGELDVNVPVSMGRTMNKAIPNSEGRFYPNDGHYSIAFNHIEEIIDTLIK